MFAEAELANFSKDERDAYEYSLEHYRDMKNVIDTAVEDKLAKDRVRIARNLKSVSLSVAQTVQSTGLSKEQVGKL